MPVKRIKRTFKNDYCLRHTHTKETSRTFVIQIMKRVIFPFKTKSIFLFMS